MPFFFEKCKIELNGHEYLIDPTSKKTVEALDKVMKTGADYMKNDHKKPQEESEKFLIETIKEATDQICGSGTFDAVFESHAVNVINAIEMWASICNDIARYKIERMNQLMGTKAA